MGILRSYIERRERAHHGRDSNRKSLPFEWGLEYVGIPPDDNPVEALLRFSSHALETSDAFYACTPPPHVEVQGELVTFPSAAVSPYPENNTVWGRYFDGGKDLAVVVLPQWNCGWDGQVGLCRVLQRSGVSSLRLSMPYHHKRKPAHLERAEYLVSPNIGLTIHAARQAVLDARRAADWLLAAGHRRVGIIGTSVGSCIAFLAFAHDQRFAAGVFIHVSGYFADVVWAGLSTSHVRRSLEQSIDLNDLRRIWAPISPYPFIQRMAGSNRPMLMLSGEYDPTFPPELSRQAYKEFQRWGVQTDVKWLPCGHYTMGEFPFSAITAYRIVRFLKKQSRSR